MHEPYSRPQSRSQLESPSTYSTLHYSYPSPQHFAELSLAQPQYDSAHEERPPAPTSTQSHSFGINSEYSTTPVDLMNHGYQPPEPELQEVSGGWITSPLVPYQRSSSPRSDYNSSSSSSSYASSPSAPGYPLFSGPDSALSSARSLPRLLLPIDPTPVAPLIADSDERRGEIGPCRDLAPLNSLRPHPYRHRDPTDDKTLRRLGPRAALVRARFLESRDSSSDD
ncbi:hypothetical protein B0H12DRAFT_119092 [Mycena haematopus]|nr:hypothetical protein B0H12DRAFT_119092 [Mycena haematopus]